MLRPITFFLTKNCGKKTNEQNKDVSISTYCRGKWNKLKNATSIKQWKLLVLCLVFNAIEVAIVVVVLLFLSPGDLKDKYFIALILKF